VNFSTKPKIIDQSSELFLPAGLTEKISFTDGETERISMLVCYLKSLPVGAKIIIFGNTIKVSKRIQFFLDSLGYKCSNLHSHMEQKLRLTKLERFKKSETINILVSTDVAARGLDFFATNVVQYGVPLNGDTYVHRAGRTARANRKGEALILVDRTEGNKWGEINDILNSSVPNRKVDKFCPAKILMD
jgi:superfamily II DNA/RNA helicase